MPAVAPKLYNDFVAVTPDDFQTLSVLGMGTEWYIYVGVGGDVSLTGRSGVAVVFKNAISGTILPARAVKVNRTGTTATDLVAVKALTAVV